MIEIPQDATAAGANALDDGGINDSWNDFRDHLSVTDRYDLASAVLHAGLPVALAAAYTALADELTELAEGMQWKGRDQTLQAVGLMEAVTVIRQRAERLRGAGT